MRLGSALAGLLLVVVVAVAQSSEASVQPPKIVHFLSPAYPSIARQAVISGRVTLTASIDKDGSVSDLIEQPPEQRRQSAGYRLLVEPAKTCVLQWKFMPGQAGRVVTVVIDYGFSSTTREVNPNTTVAADFEASTIRVAITTDRPITSHP